VGNLPASATEIDLRTKFAQFGRVLSVIIESDSKTSRRKRFGLVEMESEAEARAAIGRLNMTQYDDMVVSVSKARI
jgi:RNA recognition motif-containing protein